MAVFAKMCQRMLDPKPKKRLRKIEMDFFHEFTVRKK
jgi:hypothetical protein